MPIIVVSPCVVLERMFDQSIVAHTIVCGLTAPEAWLRLHRAWAKIIAFPLDPASQKGLT